MQELPSPTLPLPDLVRRDLLHSLDATEVRWRLLPYADLLEIETRGVGLILKMRSHWDGMRCEITGKSRAALFDTFADLQSQISSQMPLSLGLFVEPHGILRCIFREAGHGFNAERNPDGRWLLHVATPEGQNRLLGVLGADIPVSDLIAIARQLSHWLTPAGETELRNWGPDLARRERDLVPLSVLVQDPHWAARLDGAEGMVFQRGVGRLISRTPERLLPVVRTAIAALSAARGLERTLLRGGCRAPVAFAIGPEMEDRDPAAALARFDDLWKRGRASVKGDLRLEPSPGIRATLPALITAGLCNGWSLASTFADPSGIALLATMLKGRPDLRRMLIEEFTASGLDVTPLDRALPTSDSNDVARQRPRRPTAALLH